MPACGHLGHRAPPGRSPDGKVLAQGIRRRRAARRAVRSELQHPLAAARHRRVGGQGRLGAAFCPLLAVVVPARGPGLAPRSKQTNDQARRPDRAKSSEPRHRWSVTRALRGWMDFAGLTL